MDKAEGLILRGVGGFYYVFDGDRLHECKARGRFRKDGLTPMVGDRVAFSPEGERTHGYLEEILPRKSKLRRPPVANVDRVFAVIAPRAPEPDLLLLDILLIGAHRQDIEAILCVNKMDLLEGSFDPADEYIKAGYRVIGVSAETRAGIEQMQNFLAGASSPEGRIGALAGQSGVGKSSLLNLLLPNAHMETGSVSRIERGRHTTRHCELFPLPSGGYLADTPGFSLLGNETEDPDLLKTHYPEFAPYEENCRFIGCRHLREPDCAVRAAADSGLIGAGRLERYAVLYEQAKEAWDRRYG